MAKRKRQAKGKGGHVPKLNAHRGAGGTISSSDHQWIDPSGGDTSAPLRDAVSAALAKREAAAATPPISPEDVRLALETLVAEGLVTAEPGEHGSPVYVRVPQDQLTPEQRVRYAELEQLGGLSDEHLREAAGLMGLDEPDPLVGQPAMQVARAWLRSQGQPDEEPGVALRPEGGFGAGVLGPGRLDGVGESEFDIRPAAVVEERDLLAAWWMGSQGASAAETWHVTSAQRMRYPDQLSDVEVMAAYSTGRRWAQAEAGVLGLATPYHVSPEMTELVWHASRSMEVQPLHRDDLPSDRGFVWLGAPLVMPEAMADFWRSVWKAKDGTRYAPAMIRAISWASVELHGAAQPGQPGRFEHARPNDQGGMAFAVYGDHGPSPRLALYDHGAFLYGVDYTAPGEFATASDVDPAAKPARGGISLLRFVQALWAIMDQTITVQRRELPDRPTRRRLVRMGRVPEPVIVVTLRRARVAEGDEGSSPVAWSHRWLVNGHWRRIRHPRTGEQRQVWVTGHVKGPQDKPLVYKERVYDLRR